jgi:hypothetical protein
VSWLLWIAAVLVLWAGIAAIRSRAENKRQDAKTPRKDASSGADADDEIDREMLEQAEREVQDLDVNQRPEDGFEGDDWGPGAAPHRRP